MRPTKLLQGMNQWLGETRGNSQISLKTKRLAISQSCHQTQKCPLSLAISTNLERQVSWHECGLLPTVWCSQAESLALLPGSERPSQMPSTADYPLPHPVQVAVSSASLKSFLGRDGENIRNQIAYLSRENYHVNM